MFIVIKQDNNLELKKTYLKNKVSILFELKDHPAALYKCL